MSAKVPASETPLTPQDLRDHPRLSGKIYYTLPPPLLRRLERVMPILARSDGWVLEQRLAATAEGFPNCVGFSNGASIAYDLLAQPRPALDADEIVRMFKGDRGWKHITPQHFANAVEEGSRRIDWSQRVGRGYCGWLMTNARFLQEHDALVARWSSQIQRCGFPVAGLVPAALIEPDAQPANQAEANRSFAEDVQRFCVRWQLKAMAAPGLPEPLLPQFPVLSVDHVTPRMLEGGSLVYLPYNFALMPEDELRRLMEDVLRGHEPPEHLVGWTRIVAAGRKNKAHEFNRLERLFDLQHHWRVLHERWADQLRGKKTVLTEVFADHYGVGFQQMKNDVRSVRNAADQPTAPA